MSKLLNDYEQIAVTLGLRFDAARKVIYGQKNGFELVVCAENSQYPYRFSVLTGAKSQMGALTKEDCKQFAKEEKEVAVLAQKGNTIAMILNSNGKIEKICECINNGINAMTSFLRSKGFVPCCELCGQTAETETETGTGTAAFDAGGHYMQLCPECADKIRQNTAMVQQQNQQKSENLIGGIVGALLGSVIGVLCIVFFSQMNMVAAISGVVMAVCTIKGYEILSGKLTKRGVIISIIMMVIMTYVGDRIDWGILIAREWNTDFAEGFRSVPLLLQRGIIESANYWGNLGLLYVFTVLGAFPTIRSSLKERKQENTFGQVGSTYHY